MESVIGFRSFASLGSVNQLRVHFSLGKEKIWVLERERERYVERVSVLVKD